jgi:hypothetical protein
MENKIKEKNTKNNTTNKNGFKKISVPKDNNFVKKILGDVTGINLTDQEVTKLKVFLQYDVKGSLFSSIDSIYGIIGANFTKPSRFLIIPFVKDGAEHINIQKI